MKKLSISAVNAAQQSQINISLTFNYLRENGPSNRSRIAADLKLSIPAVSRAIETLQLGGYIIQDDDESTSARKGTPVYAANTDFGFVVAIDIFSVETEAAIVDFSGRIRCRVNGFHPELTVDVAADLTALIDRCIDSFVAECSGKKEMIRAIGLGVPAVVDQETGTLKLSCYDVYEEIDFIRLLEGRYKLPVYMENISSLSALGEKTYGKRGSMESLVLLEVGAGIGSGIIIDGVVYRGRGYAGEIGFSLTDRDDVVQTDRRIGLLEKKASLTALKYNVLRELSLGSESSLLPLFRRDRNSITYHLIFEHAIQGDALSRRLIEEMVLLISVALYNMTIIIHPESIVIGGDICTMPETERLILMPIRTILQQSLPFDPPEISSSSLGRESGILGAAVLAIDSMLSEEFPYHRKARD